MLSGLADCASGSLILDVNDFALAHVHTHTHTHTHTRTDVKQKGIAPIRLGVSVECVIDSA